MNETPAPLDAMPGHRLRQAAARATQQLAAALLPHGVTPAEWTAMQVLHDGGPVPPSALADACGLTRGAATKLVDRLRARGLVVRAAAGRDDRRYQTIALTGAGARLLPVLAEAARAGEAAAFAVLTAAQRTTLIALLRTVGTGGAASREDAA